MKSKFTDDEKQSIINRYISNSESLSDIINSVGISKSTFYKWLSDYRKNTVVFNRKSLTIHNFNVLETKIKRLETIIEIIRKANIPLNSPLKQKLNAAEILYKNYNIHLVCDALCISRGTFYNHILRNKRDNTWYAKKREALRMQIQ